MGLDLSLTGTGVALTDGSTALIKTGSLRGCERLAHIRHEVTSLVFAPDGAMVHLVVIEDYAAHSPGNEAPKAELHGVILLALYDWSIPVALVNPATLKKYATGKGTAKKEDMKLAAYKQFGREFPSNDECDAFFLRCMGLEATSGVLRRDHNTDAMRKARAEALTKVEWPEVGR